jgi:hypothetical protein
LALLAIGNIQREKRSLSARTIITSAKAIIIAAPAVRMVARSMPSAGPKAPRNTPMAANDSVMPRPVATGARRLPWMLAPATSGRSGCTQGDKVVSPPAAKAQAQLRH